MNRIYAHINSFRSDTISWIHPKYCQTLDDILNRFDQGFYLEKDILTKHPNRQGLTPGLIQHYVWRRIDFGPV